MIDIIEAYEKKTKGNPGVFYTPLHIARYMCNESLISYLDANIERSDEVDIIEQNKRQLNLF